MTIFRRTVFTLLVLTTLPIAVGFLAFSPLLTAFADGPEQASTSIPGGQPLSMDEDGNVQVRLLGNAAAVHTPFAVHVTGYCGVPFVTPA